MLFLAITSNTYISILTLLTYLLSVEYDIIGYLGREPSGGGFNSLNLTDHGLPHNPLINSGAIMACSFIGSKKHSSDRLKMLLDVWGRIAGIYLDAFVLYNTNSN